MRAASETGWSHAVQHRFVNELFAGAVPDAVMARYLTGPPLSRQFSGSARCGACQRRHVRGQAALWSLHRHGVGREKHLFPSGVRSARRHRAKRRRRAAMRPRFRSSWWPNGCISIGPPARRSRCRTTSYTRSGSRCTTILIFVGSSISCARSWTVSARQTQICAATSFLALWRSNSPFSKPPMRAEFS
jgi:hypothetical protein